MDGLFFLMSIAGIGLVMYWVVSNDQAAPDQPTRGMFAMLEQARRAGRKSSDPLSPASAPVQAETAAAGAAGRRRTGRP